MTPNIFIGPPADGPICDFCSSRFVTAQYHAKTFEVEPLVPLALPVRQHSVGDWAACQECEKLIDAKDWEGLVDRAVLAFFIKYPELELIGLSRDRMREDFWKLYRQLMNNDFRKERKI